MEMVHLEESLSTLQFAKRAKKIKNNAVVNITKSPEEMQKLIYEQSNLITNLRVLLNENEIDHDKIGSEPAKISKSSFINKKTTSKQSA